MSEGKCGKVAIEALVTVCRAMPQLEVGQFAVASFGKKGNVECYMILIRSSTTEKPESM
jgi:midasin